MHINTSLLVTLCIICPLYTTSFTPALGVYVSALAVRLVVHYWLRFVRSYRMVQEWREADRDEREKQRKAEQEERAKDREGMLTTMKMMLEALKPSALSTRP